MEYPGTKFTKKWRIALLISTISAFVIIAPTIILYSMGFRYDWQYGILRQGGSLSVDILPKNGDVFLNNIKLNKNIIDKKIEIKNIKPAKYNLTIKTDGYYDWKKEIEIKNGKTEYIKEVNLLKKNSPQSLVDIDVNEISLSPDNNILLYTDKEKNIYLKRFNDSSTDKIVSKLDNADNLIFEWGEKNDCVFLANYKDKIYTNIQLVCPYDTEIITKLTTGKILNKIQWDNNIVPLVYYSDKINIYSYNLDTKRTQTISKNDYVDWYLVGNTLWTININTTTQSFDIIEDALGFTKKFSSISVKDKNEFNDTEKQWSILDIRNGNILLRKKETQNMLLVNSNKQYKITADKYTISPYNQWWIIWSEWELWTYTDNNEPFLLNRSGETLKKVLPLDQYNTLGLVWKNKFSARYPYYLVESTLLDIKIDKAEADSITKTLYYTEINKKGIWKLNY